MIEDIKISSNSDKHSFSRKVLQTLILVVCWVCLGLMMEIYGPTLIDLKTRLQSNYDDTASALASKAIGTLAGTLLSGVLIDKFGGFCDLMVAISLDVIAAATIAVPWAPNSDVIWGLCCIQGVGIGVLAAAGMKLIFNMWLEKAASPMHILHCGYGIGSLLIPLIANPFLAVSVLDADTVHQNNTLSFSTANFTSNGTSVVGDITTSREGMISSNNGTSYLKPSRIEYAYLIPSLVSIGLSVIFYIYHISNHMDKKETRICSAHNTKSLKFKQMINPATCAGGNLVYGLVIFILLFMFFFNFTGAERIYGTFLRSFSIDHFGFSVDEGSYVNTSFWISYTVGRVVGMFAAGWLTIRKLIMIETGGLLVSAILYVAVSTDSATAFWVVTQAVGFFSGPLYPSGMGWANCHVEMTGTAISLCMTGSCFGAFVYLKLLGYLYETNGPLVYLYSLLFYSVAMFLITGFLNIVGMSFKKIDTKDPKVELCVKNEDNN